MPRTLTGLLLTALAVTAAGCGPHKTPWVLSSPTHAPRPCGGKPAASVRLGNPGQSTPGRAAYFQTNGAPLYITAHHFDHTGVLDSPRGSSAFYIGHANTRPVYDERRDTIAPLVTQLSVWEGEYGTFTIPAGRYWLLNSTGGDIELLSCTPNAIHGTPAPRPTIFPTPTTPRITPTP
jgi:hypothetical protein